MQVMTERRATPKKSAQYLSCLCSRFNESKKKSSVNFWGKSWCHSRQIRKRKSGIRQWALHAMFARHMEAESDFAELQMEIAAFFQFRSLYGPSVTLLRKKREHLSTNYSPSKPYELEHGRKRSFHDVCNYLTSADLRSVSQSPPAVVTTQLFPIQFLLICFVPFSFV